MAATQYYFSGIAEWAKVYPANKDNYAGKTFYSIDLIVPDKEYERFMSTGTKQKPKKESEGFYRLSLRRNEDASREEWGGPPKVIIEDPDNPGMYKDFEELIGNGSEVTVRVTVYDTAAYGKGTRLDVVRVDNHVAFGGTKVDTTGVDIGVPF